MSKDVKEPKIKVLKTRIPKTCICPDCGKKQPFRKNRIYWKIVKEMDLDNTVKLKVRMISAKCLNPSCKRKTFALPVPGIEKYKRSTTRLIDEAVAGIVQDNSTLPRISKRLNRSFNTTGSKSAIDRWKHNIAD